MSEVGVLAMQISVAVSLFLSGVVMVRIARFGLYRKVFLKIIFYISLCDFFKSLALVWGRQASSPALCSLQGAMVNYFELAAFLWSAAIAHEVSLVVFQGRVLADLRALALLCWLSPLLPSLLPLALEEYAVGDESPGWCSLGEESRTQFFGFFLYLGLVFAYLLYVLCAVSYKLFVSHGGRNNVDGVRVVRRIACYPVVLFVCWSAITALEFGESFGVENEINPDGALGVTFFFVLPSLQGALTAFATLVLNCDVDKQPPPSAAPQADSPSFCDRETELTLNKSSQLSQPPEDDWWAQTESDSKSFGEMASWWRNSLHGAEYSANNAHNPHKTSSSYQTSSMPATLGEEERREKDDDPQAMESGDGQEKETNASINPLFGSCKEEHDDKALR